MSFLERTSQDAMKEARCESHCYSHHDLQTLMYHYYGNHIERTSLTEEMKDVEEQQERQACRSLEEI